MVKRHPFAGRNGSAFRDRIASQLFATQAGRCAMCHNPLPPSLRGKTEGRHAVLDHIKPHRLRPDLSLTPDNLHLICRNCHAKCETIEAAHWPDADLIAEAKQREGETWA